MRIRMNPILKKELQVGSRTMKLSWGIFALNTLLSVIAIVVMAALEAETYNSSYSYANLVALFPILGIVECVILSLIIPIITSGAISGERERQTLDLMLSTPMKPFAIAIGKLESAMVPVLMYMVSSLPVLAVAFMLGGMNWLQLLGLLVMMFFIGIYVGSIGIFCSSLVKRSVTATVLSFLITWGIVVATFVLFISITHAERMAAYRAGIDTFMATAEPMILLFNPFAAVADFFLRTTTSGSVYAIAGQWHLYGQAGIFPAIREFFYRYWMVVACVLHLVISYVFLRLAAAQIAIRPRKKKSQ